MRPDLPFLFLSITPLVQGTAMVVAEMSAPDTAPGIRLGHHRIHPELCRHQGEARDVVLIGTPFEGEAIDRPALARKLAEMDDPLPLMPGLNGEFTILIHDKRANAVDIYTDRIGSFPIYWAAKGDAFYASTNYLDLARAIAFWPGFRLRPEKAYEFLVMQRLMGTETHDTLSACVPATSRLRVNLSALAKPEIIRYLKPFQKPRRTDSIHAQAREFIPMLDRAVKRRVDGEGPGMGLFMSGGHDGRLIAGVSKEKITCYTYSLADNNEVHCARLVAQARGHDFEFIQVPDDYFTRTLDMSSWMGSGMYAMDHALFLPVPGRHNPHSRIYMNGHGLDYFFHGVYLNARWVNFMGRQTFFRTMQPYPDDMAEHYMDTISYRLKYDLNGELVRPEFKKKMRDAVHGSVSNVLDEGRRFSADKNDQWDHLAFHILSRHFTYGNILSMRVDGEVRTPGYDRELFDFNFSLQPEHRLHADLLRMAMQRRCFKLAMLPAGNFGMPAGTSPLSRTAWLIGRKVLRDLTGSKKFIGPQPSDRTWPDRTDYMKSHPDYWHAATEPLRDKAFRDMTDFLDWEKIEANAERILDYPVGGAAFWTYMLSYYRFYKLLTQG